MKCCDICSLIIYCITTFATFIPITALLCLTSYDSPSYDSMTAKLYKSCSLDTEICDETGCYRLEPIGFLMCKTTNTTFNILIVVVSFHLLVTLIYMIYSIYECIKKIQQSKFLEITLVINSIVLCMDIGFGIALLFNYLSGHIISGFLMYAIIIFDINLICTGLIWIFMFCYFIIFRKCIKRKIRVQSEVDEELLEN